MSDTQPCLWAHPGIHHIRGQRRCSDVKCVGYDSEYEVVGPYAGNPIKYMDPEEFRELGYLQEVNRLLLHTAGLALALGKGENGENFVQVWDYRSDPEGMIFGAGVIDKQKVDNVRIEREAHTEARLKIFGPDSNAIQDTEF